MKLRFEKKRRENDHKKAQEDESRGLGKVQLQRQNHTCESRRGIKRD